MVMNLWKMVHKISAYIIQPVLITEAERSIVQTTKLIEWASFLDFKYLSGVCIADVLEIAASLNLLQNARPGKSETLAPPSSQVNLE